MKILIICAYNIFPPYWGATSRTYNIVKNLSKENEVFLLCNDYKSVKDFSRYNCEEFKSLKQNSNVKIYFVDSKGKKSQVVNRKLIFKGLEIIKNENPDIIISETLLSGFHGLIFRFLKGVPFILDEHNVEYIRFNRMNRGNRFTRMILKYYEYISCKFSEKVFCCSKTDKRFLSEKLNISEKKIVVIPNGIDTDKFYPNKKNNSKIRKKLNVNEETPLVLFFGKLDYIPNMEAIDIIYREILPKFVDKKPSCKFLIVGVNPPLNYSHNNLIFTGMVDKIEDYINVSDVVISPLISGGGTRIKILEAIACGKNVVSTKIGAEGLINKKSNEIIVISDNWEDFVNKTINLLKNKPSVEKKCLEFSEEYSWKKISKRIQEILCSYNKHS